MSMVCLRLPLPHSPEITPDSLATTSWSPKSNGHISDSLAAIHPSDDTCLPNPPLDQPLQSQSLFWTRLRLPIRQAGAVQPSLRLQPCFQGRGARKKREIKTFPSSAPSALHTEAHQISILSCVWSRCQTGRQLSASLRGARCSAGPQGSQGRHGHMPLTHGG